MERCTECQATELKKISEPDSLRVGEHSFTAQIPAWRCGNCGAVYFDGPSLGRFEQQVAVHLVRSGQTSSGPVVRFLRKDLGLRAKDLAELLGVIPETVSRWENGKTPVDRNAAALLGAMVLEQNEGLSLIRDALRALGHPRPLGESVQIEVAPAA